MQLLLRYNFAAGCIYLLATAAVRGAPEIPAHKYCEAARNACLTPAPTPLSATATAPDLAETKTWLNTTTTAAAPTIPARAVCATNMKSCRKFANQCEFERANCKAATWTRANMHQCSNIMAGHKGACTCPMALNCSSSKTMCARNKLSCKKFQNECDYKMARCRGESWLPTNPLYCCQFRTGETSTCRITVTQPTCGTINNKICHHFRNYCEFIDAYQSSNAAYREVGLENCKCVVYGAAGQCGCSKAPLRL